MLLGLAKQYQQLAARLSRVSLGGSDDCAATRVEAEVCRLHSLLSIV